MRRMALVVPLLLAVTVYAQVGPTARRTNVTSGVIVSTGDGITFNSGVKAAPFSADIVTETVRTLADGNHIDKTEQGSICRDSEGRTRQETSLPRAEDARLVFIIDPVQQVRIRFVTNGDKVATVTPMHSSSSTSTTRPVNAGSNTSSTVAAPGLHVARPTREDLGTREIEGLTVQGTRITRTTEAGQIGNEQPIISVTESWYSKELHEVLLTETDDPQFGHRTTKLVNIQRDEPDLALFQVPPDYTVKEQ